MTSHLFCFRSFCNYLQHWPITAMRQCGTDDCFPRVRILAPAVRAGEQFDSRVEGLRLHRGKESRPPPPRIILFNCVSTLLARPRFSEKVKCGEFFFLAQLVLLPALAVASLAHLFAPLVILAFVPAVVRGSQWFFRKPQPLDVKRLGWSEMKHGVAFGVLLAIALLYR